MSSDQPPETIATPAGPPDQPTQEETPRSHRKILPVGLALAVLGGGLTWAVLRACYPVATVPLDLLTVTVLSPQPLQQRAAVARRREALYNPVFGCALLGALLSGAMGLATGPARGPWSRMVAAAGAAVVGGGVGAVAGVGVYRYCPNGPVNSAEGEVIQFILLHVGTLAVVGAGVGLGVGVAMWRSRAAITGLFAGVLGGALAGLTYSALVVLLVARVDRSTAISFNATESTLWVATASLVLGLIVPSFICTPGNREK
jgi:hypothetical protein